MNKNCIHLLTIAVFLYANVASADPPIRVARLSLIDGTVSFLPANTNDWLAATLNRPFVVGDRLWNGVDTHSELQMGAASLRIWSNTDLNILNLDNVTAQFQINQGTINLRIWRISPEQVYEIDTPNLAFSVNQRGNYRIDVDAENNLTTVTLYAGEGIIYGLNSSLVMHEGQSYTFSGTDLASNQGHEINLDEFDKWCSSRDERTLGSGSARYLSNDTIGYEDLDDYGTWQSDSVYGAVWVPNNLPSDWAPYRDGYWIWIDPWGWTWMDNSSWGFAPYHYGRWIYSNDTWAWIPGPVWQEPVYAPALVVFLSVGSVADIAWFPLGPGDPYIPPYTVSQQYFIGINTSNSNLDKHALDNIYLHPDQMINYHNLPFKNAITAVPTQTFNQGKNILRATIPVSTDMLSHGEIKHVPNLAPSAASIVGQAVPATIKPPQAVISRKPIVKLTPLPSKSATVKPTTTVIPSSAAPLPAVIQHHETNMPTKTQPPILPASPVVKPTQHQLNPPMPPVETVTPSATPSQPIQAPEHTPEHKAQFHAAPEPSSISSSVEQPARQQPLPQRTFTPSPFEQDQLPNHKIQSYTPPSSRTSPSHEMPAPKQEPHAPMPAPEQHPTITHLPVINAPINSNIPVKEKNENRIHDNR